MAGVHFCLRSFIVDGTLGGAKPGMSRSQIHEVLGPPDDVSLRREAIWRYGNFEVHFDGDRVFLLFTDYIHRLDSGPGRTLDPWIAADSSFSKAETLTRLSSAGVSYQLLDGGELGVIARVSGGADLSFHDPADGLHPLIEWSSISVMEPHMQRAYPIVTTQR